MGSASENVTANLVGYSDLNIAVNYFQSLDS